MIQGGDFSEGELLSGHVGQTYCPNKICASSGLVRVFLEDLLPSLQKTSSVLNSLKAELENIAPVGH